MRGGRRLRLHIYDIQSEGRSGVAPDWFPLEEPRPNCAAGTRTPRVSVQSCNRTCDFPKKKAPRCYSIESSRTPDTDHRLVVGHK